MFSTSFTFEAWPLSLVWNFRSESGHGHPSVGIMSCVYPRGRKVWHLAVPTTGVMEDTSTTKDMLRGEHHTFIDLEFEGTREPLAMKTQGKLPVFFFFFLRNGRHVEVQLDGSSDILVMDGEGKCSRACPDSFWLVWHSFLQVCGRTPLNDGREGREWPLGRDLGIWGDLWREVPVSAAHLREEEFWFLWFALREKGRKQEKVRDTRLLTSRPSVVL